MVAQNIGVDMESLRSAWIEEVEQTLKEATLSKPGDEFYIASGSRSGYHTEHLSHMLAEMQVLQRTHPGAEW